MYHLFYILNSQASLMLNICNEYTGIHYGDYVMTSHGPWSLWCYFFHLTLQLRKKYKFISVLRVYNYGINLGLEIIFNKMVTHKFLRTYTYSDSNSLPYEDIRVLYQFPIAFVSLIFSAVMISKQKCYSRCGMEFMLYIYGHEEPIIGIALNILL